MKICSREYVIKTMTSKLMRAKKRYSQNFLVDENLAEMIVSKLEINNQDSIIEIGPGLGALSQLLIDKSNNVILYEIDEEMVNHLNEEFQSRTVTIHHLDFLKEDLNKYKEQQIKFISNVPYNVTSPIIEKIVTTSFRPKLFEFMIQKEVYDRLKAKVGNKDYGPLNILLEYVGNLELVAKVNRDAYIPAPHVDSVVLLLTFNETYDPQEAEKLIKLLKVSFSMRRKTIFNNLSAKYEREKVAQILQKAEIDPSSRAEDLKLNQFLKLVKAI